MRVPLFYNHGIYNIFVQLLAGQNERSDATVRIRKTKMMLSDYSPKTCQSERTRKVKYSAGVEETDMKTANEILKMMTLPPLS